MLPSLHERMSRWSKSRLRVSSTPITCKPTAGSPWNGTDVLDIICRRSFSRVILSISTSSFTISDERRLRSVNILNRLSSRNGSSPPVSRMFTAAVFTMAVSHDSSLLQNSLLVPSPSIWVNRSRIASSLDSLSTVT